jgi:hypothetical protein
MIWRKKLSLARICSQGNFASSIKQLNNIIMLSKGYKIIILAVISIALIVTIILVFVSGLKKDNQENTQAVIDETLPAPKNEIIVNLPQLSDEEKNQTAVKNLALIFTERFGTYSLSNDSSIFNDLEPLMTESFSQWVSSTYKNKVTAELAASSYSSVSTKALAVEFEKIAATSATVVVTTARTKKDSGEPLNFEEKIKLVVVQNNGIWLIDSANWLK